MSQNAALSDRWQMHYLQLCWQSPQNRSLSQDSKQGREVLPAHSLNFARVTQFRPPFADRNYYFIRQSSIGAVTSLRGRGQRVWRSTYPEVTRSAHVAPVLADDPQERPVPLVPHARRRCRQCPLVSAVPELRETCSVHRAGGET